MTDLVLSERVGNVTTLTLNRPERKNAATIDLGEELQLRVAAADRDADTRVIVLTGAGDAFCAGDDVQTWNDPRMEDILRGLGGPRAPLTPEVKALLDTGKPIIAAVNGVAIGSGMDLAMACDIIVASDTARFGQGYVRMGLMADVLGYWRLPQLVGPSRAAQLLLTGDIIDAATAERYGLVSDVVPAGELQSTVAALAARIAANPPLAVRYIKEGLRRGAGRPASDLPELAAFVGNGLHRLFASHDHQEAAAAFVAKRPPVFSGE